MENNQNVHLCKNLVSFTTEGTNITDDINVSLKETWMIVTIIGCQVAFQKISILHYHKQHGKFNVVSSSIGIWNVQRTF